jgi:hypothetical protein
MRVLRYCSFGQTCFSPSSKRATDLPLKSPCVEIVAPFHDALIFYAKDAHHWKGHLFAVEPEVVGAFGQDQIALTRNGIDPRTAAMPSSLGKGML